MNGVVTLAAAVKVGSVLCYYRSCIAYTAHIYTRTPSLFFSHISMHISETQIAIYFYIFSLFCSTIVLSMRTSCICGTLYTETTHTQVYAHTSRRQRHKHIGSRAVSPTSSPRRLPFLVEHKQRAASDDRDADCDDDDSNCVCVRAE